MMFCYSVVGLRIRQLFIKGRICWAELSWGVSKDYGHEEITLHKLGVGAILFHFFFLSLFIYRVNLCCTCFIFFLLSFSFLVFLNGFALKFYYIRLVFIFVFFTVLLKKCIFKIPLSKFVYKSIDWIYNNQFGETYILL